MRIFLNNKSYIKAKNLTVKDEMLTGRSVVLAKTSLQPQKSQKERWTRCHKPVWPALVLTLLPLESRGILPFVSTKDPGQPKSLLLFACDAFLKYEQCPFLTTAFESVVPQLLNK